jgi:hypothetical protein
MNIFKKKRPLKYIDEMCMILRDSVTSQMFPTIAKVKNPFLNEFLFPQMAGQV